MIKELRARVAGLEQELKDAKYQLDVMVANCNHAWSEAKYTPDHIEGGRFGGDAPGTMGVDYRAAIYIPPRDIPKWTRTCSKCGKTETTDRTTVETHVKTRPQF